MRTRLIAVMVALAAVAVFTTEASAMYHAGMGVFMQRDPGPGAGAPARTGAPGPATGGGFAQRDPITRPPNRVGHAGLNNQYANGMNLYGYVGSNPVVRRDPSGLWWPFWHADATLQKAPTVANFNDYTLGAMVASNVYTDFGVNKKNPVYHYIADKPNLVSRGLCWARSEAAISKLIRMASEQATQCRQKKYDRRAGQWGIIYLGTALHIAQDASAHHCMTTAEHGLDENSLPLGLEGAIRDIEVDTPLFGEGRANYPKCLARTTREVARFKNTLGGWNRQDMKCCVEEPFQSWLEVAARLVEAAITPVGELPGMQ